MIILGSAQIGWFVLYRESQFENAVSRYNKIILEDLKNAGVKCWIAGGALRDYFMGAPIKTDYDLFFPDENRGRDKNIDLTSKSLCSHFDVFILCFSFLFFQVYHVVFVYRT